MTTPLEMRGQVEWALRDLREGRLHPESGVIYALVQRLQVAEDVCLMTGWTGADQTTERGQALSEVWQRWYQLVGEAYATPSNHPHLDDAHIAELARQRDEKRARTLASLVEDARDA